MSGLRDLANRLDGVVERVQAAAVSELAERIGGEMLQQANDHRFTGQLADTLQVGTERDAVTFTTREYRPRVPWSFARGIPRRMMRAYREALAAKIERILKGGA